MKILLYGDRFLPSVGGVQTSLGLLARGLAELDAQGTSAGAGRNEVTVATRTAANGMDDSSLPYRVVRQPGFWRLVGLIREADVVHVAGPCLLPLSIAWLLRKPAVVEHHGYQANCPNGLLFKMPSQTVCPGHFAQGRYRECLRCCSSTMGLTGGFRTLLLMFPRRWLCKRVVANITITDHVATRLKLPRSRTIYYGIDEASQVGAGEIPSRSRTLKVAYVGRLVVEKGPVLALHAEKYLNDRGTAFSLAFIGDGPERNALETLVESLGLRNSVTFTGDLRGADLDRAASKIDVVVMPSVCEETAGLSAIEQMMRGRVVIASDIGGLSEVVGDAGLKFTPGDSEALASCVQQVIDNPTLMTSVGSAARARALQLFRRDSMIQNHLLLYREVASY
ncbi:MAG: glycosyltransferase family 4 protein [Acidobacteriia bacterium]|nr:glycosyltransferase family 4 protein [Terriglobia bacterium]